MRLYNTLNNKMEEFEPINPKEVKMYACGITVYDLSHIGHACQAIIYDIIRRYFEYKGYKVTYVRNYTDVDDKIINKANELGISPTELSEKMIKQTEQDLNGLRVRSADFNPKATEHIEEIIKLTQGLIDKGYAYATPKGDVYFVVNKFVGYGKLSNRNIEELESGTRKEVEEDKQNPLDFALWKAAKPGEIYWQSPWGNGRPGWHIECSAMSMKYLGEHFDIHGGGKDLIFPHHENEIAQSEAYTGKPFANYWIHNGLVTINGQKMSKSLGNFVTVKDMLENYNFEVIRYGIIQNNYMSDFDYSEELFQIVEKRLYYFYQTIDKLKKYIADNPTDGGKLLNHDLVDGIQANFLEAMDNNFNTAVALSNLSEIFKYLNDLYANKNESVQDKVITFKMTLDGLSEIGQILGLFGQEPKEFIAGIRDKYIKKNNIDVTQVEALVQKRWQAKQDRDFELADGIRNELGDKGIVLKDIEGATEWDLKELY